MKPLIIAFLALSILAHEVKASEPKAEPTKPEPKKEELSSEMKFCLSAARLEESSPGKWVKTREAYGAEMFRCARSPGEPGVAVTTTSCNELVELISSFEYLACEAEVRAFKAKGESPTK